MADQHDVKAVGPELNESPSMVQTPRRCSFLNGSKQVGDVGKSQHVAEGARL